MGEVYLEGCEWNQGGDFQDKYLENSLIEACLGEYPVPCDLPAPQRFLDRVQERVARGHDWGFKSTRIAPFLSAFAEVVGRENIIVLQTVRSASESQASWKARSQCNQEQAEVVIETVREQIVDGLHKAGLSATLLVDFQQLIETPEVVVEAIANVVGRPVTPEAAAWINADWRRFIDG